MNTASKKRYECLGGPLCGEKVRRGPRFVWQDDERDHHFYRLIKVMTNDRSKIATFYHYFGRNPHYASTAHPRMLPGQKTFRPVKKR